MMCPWLMPDSARARAGFFPPGGAFFPRTVVTMRICVFLSAADLDDRYTRPAREFAELLGKGGHTLVWGGSDVGLMKVVADGVQEAGGRLCGGSLAVLAGNGRPGGDGVG